MKNNAVDIQKNLLSNAFASYADILYYVNYVV